MNSVNSNLNVPKIQREIFDRIFCEGCNIDAAWDKFQAIMQHVPADELARPLVVEKRAAGVPIRAIAIRYGLTPRQVKWRQVSVSVDWAAI